MKSYLSHLQSMYSEKTFRRKIEYITYNVWPHIQEFKSTHPTFLEIGSGLGEFVSFYTSETNGSIDIVDNDKTVLEYVAKRYSVAKTFETNDLALIDKKLRKYDGVIGIHVLEHIPPTQYAKVLRVLVKHLKPGGKIIFVVPNGNNPLGLVERYGDLQHYCLFTTRSLLDFVALVDDSNLDPRVIGYHIPPSTILNIIRIFLQKVLHLFLLSLLMINGGIFFTILTPNVMLVITKKKSTHR